MPSNADASGSDDAGQLVADAGPGDPHDAGGTQPDAGTQRDAGAELLPQFDPPLCLKLQQLIAAEVDGGFVPGIVFSARSADGGRCVGAAGLEAVGSAAPMTVDAQFRIGSVTKTFVAATVLQLVEAGTVHLDDAVTKWLPSFPARDVTVEMLLQHSSGLDDYLYESSVQATVALPHTDAELLAIAIAVGVQRPDAGTSTRGTWSYSNTNYLLLGAIIQAATGQHWSAQVRSRFLNRADLRLGSTWVDGYEDPPPGAHLVPGAVLMSTGQWAPASPRPHATVLGAAGCMVSSMVDLDRWWRALNQGAVLAPATLQLMRTHVVPVVTGKSWGLGVEIEDGASLGTLYSHGGGLIGYSTAMQHFEGPDMTLTLAINGSWLAGDPLERVDPVTHQHRGIRPQLWVALLGL